MSTDDSSAWEEYFSQKIRYACPNRDIEFNIYISLPIDEIRGDDTPVVLCLHGAGYSGLTFAPLTRAIAKERPQCCIVAPDLRGHGDTWALDEMDMSAKTLVEDVDALYTHLRHDCNMSGPLILVGWSMGAAIAVKYACSTDDIKGLVAIDVVEGTALASLRTMSGVLQQRPKGFACMSDAVAWALNSGTSRREQSATISIPGMLKYCNSGFEGQRRREDKDVLMSHSEQLGRITEGSSSTESPVPDKEYTYTWRVDLARSEPYWEGWFKGLSQAFLDVPCPKVLVLAGTDRLDKTLMIAHMQGKFQLNVIAKSGHAVHEDQPELVADTIANFMTRYKIV